MKPSQPLPIDASWQSVEDYIDSLLTFVSTSELFRNLCGGVHILDFLTRKPDLYTHVLPKLWRDWFEEVNIEDILDLLLRESLDQFIERHQNDCEKQWRGYSPPPDSLVKYVDLVRRLSLKREFRRRNDSAKRDLEALPRHISVGMKPKKIHEVTQIAALVDELLQYLPCNYDPKLTSNGGEGIVGENIRDEQTSYMNKTSEPAVIDFGSGQNYLGRTLACPPYNKKVIAIEQRHHNVEGARGMDVSAKLIKKEKLMVNKKEWKAQWEADRAGRTGHEKQQERNLASRESIPKEAMLDIASRIPRMLMMDDNDTASNLSIAKAVKDSSIKEDNSAQFTENLAVNNSSNEPAAQEEETDLGAGSVTYIEKELSSGDLADVLSTSSSPSMVVSIHSCGNLTHHGLRSIVLNPSVQAVALVGCCYNLLTERLGPPTYKLPTLRSNHPRLEATSSAFDPHGFPMSRKLECFTYPISTSIDRNTNKTNRRVYNLNGELQEIDSTGRGIRLNITARMMAVQAPQNWGPQDSEEFFTRHYYRALLQRMLLDLGVVKMAEPSHVDDVEIAGGTLSGKDETGTPLIIGSLPKRCFASFEAYIQGAIEKLSANPIDGPDIQLKTQCLLENEGAMIYRYKDEYKYAKKHLSVIWSLMAFSASVVESTILVDRWLWLKEQSEVESAWVEAVFDYKQSPRNMAVIGIKRQSEQQ